MRKKIPNVCLIIGNAHGGTTITNILIGQHPDVESVGSLRGFPENGQIVHDNFCSCGESAKTCSYWVKIVDHIDKDQSLFVLDRELFKKISEVSNTRYSIDVDHGFRRLIELALNQDIALKVVYVNRSIRGVLYSQIRKFKSKKESNWPIRYFVHMCLKVGLEWSMKKTIVKYYCESKDIDYLILDYSDLCFNPKNQLLKIGDLLNIDYNTIADRLEVDRQLKIPDHLIRGNQNLRRKDIITLRFDDSYLNKNNFTGRFLTFIGMTVGYSISGLMRKLIVNKLEKKVRSYTQI